MEYWKEDVIIVDQMEILL